MKSCNNNLVLEPYKGSNKIETTGVSTGFATVKQKSNLIGLKSLANGIIVGVGGVQENVEKGQTVYFEEEQLHAGGWAKKTYTCEGIEGGFILAPGNLAVMVL